MKVNYYLYRLTLADEYKVLGNWTEQTVQVIEQHKNFLMELGRLGHLILAGRTDLDFEDKDLFGIALLKTNSLEEAAKLVSQDPAVINGIQKAALFPYRSAMEFFDNF